MSGAAVALRGISKRFGATVAVSDLDIQLPAGSLTALLGPSGCGKTTTLAVIAGLLTPDAGDIRIAGTSVLAAPAERRPVGVVFQKPLLFPHLNVAQNVAFGLRMRRVGRGETRRRVHAMLDRVQLRGLADRRVGELSGGQEQRVALARALVLSPQVLLLDEPFSQLDAGLRAQMRTLVRELHEETKVTTVFVTHDQAEAVEVADSITLLLDGTLAGSGPPKAFYTAPPSLAAARFFGVTNELAGRVSAGTFRGLGCGLQMAAALPDGPAALVVRPEAVQLATSPGRGDLSAVVVSARFAGTHLTLEARLPNGTGCPGVLRVHTPLGASVDVGGSVYLHLPPEACTVFSTISGRAPRSANGAGDVRRV